MYDLTILCVSNFGAHAQPFITQLAKDAQALDASLVIGADGPQPEWLTDLATVPLIVHIASKGYVESVLDQALTACSTPYVLRMDDDERCSPQMLAWLAAGNYRQADHWAFPRMHLWPDEQHYITNPPLWPDLQTRLSVREKAGGRTAIHQGSPHGTGRVAECAIEHHKFLVRDLAEREQLVERYEQLQPGAGSAFVPFSLPERFTDQITLGLVNG